MKLNRIILCLLLILPAVTVTTRASAQSFTSHLAEAHRARAGAQDDPRMAIFQALFFGQLTVAFDETPARDVFTSLGKELGITVIGRYSDDRIGYGIDPRIPITIFGEDLLPLDVLETGLEQCSVDEECTWQVRKGYLEVGTKERLSVPGARDIRIYPVEELIFEVPQFRDAPSLRLDHVYSGYRGRYAGPVFEHGGYGGSRRYTQRDHGGGARNQNRLNSLIELITETIEPEAWKRNGGDRATVSYRDGGLIVNAPPYIHRQIGGTPRVPPPR
ncbi:MAG: hypothetical protein ACYSU7_07375 [Planctomycetota bacterium]|jgi:hypothetical protein